MLDSNKYKLNQKEFKNLFDKQYPSLCIFANKYVVDLDVSKDIVQDVFIKIWKNNIEFKNENSVKSFLYTSIKNKSLDYLKSNHVRRIKNYSILELEKIETEAFFLSEVVISEATVIIESALNTLPNKCRQIIRLSIKNFSNEEISEDLGISINTVKTQKKIAYKKLKPLLKNYFSLIAYIFDFCS